MNNVYVHVCAYKFTDVGIWQCRYFNVFVYMSAHVYGCAYVWSDLQSEKIPVNSSKTMRPFPRANANVIKSSKKTKNLLRQECARLV